MGKSCSKFGKIQPSDLGGNSVTDRDIYNSHIALKRGDNNNNKAKRKKKKTGSKLKVYQQFLDTAAGNKLRTHSNGR